MSGNVQNYANKTPVKSPKHLPKGPKKKGTKANRSPNPKSY